MKPGRSGGAGASSDVRSSRASTASRSRTTRRGNRAGSAGETEIPVCLALDTVLRLTAPADSALRAFFRAHPELGRRDRAEIAETVFDVLRNRRRYASLVQGGQGRIERRLALLSLKLRDAWPTAGARSALPRPDVNELAWLDHCLSVDQALKRQAESGRADPVASLAHLGSLPDWMAERLIQRYGAEDARSLALALLGPAPVQLRVNALKARPEPVLEALNNEGIPVRPFPLVPEALELEGRPSLEHSPCWVAGQIEVQDAGSQMLALLVGARRGQTVIDLCAGAGGKTLALAASMRSTGQIFACDVSAERLRRMRPRLARGGVTNVQPFAIDDLNDRKLLRLAGRADAVLVDAPCSGSGTWRRNPDLKWRIGPADLARLVAEQRALLRTAASLVRPGGILVYGTCSLFAEENEQQLLWFEQAFPGFRREAADAVLGAQGVTDAARICPDGLLSTRPDRDGTDGFFGARWRAPD
ncbi:MAG: hypothetical protein RL322_757 [Pseudomonadota bacterium]